MNLNLYPMILLATAVLLLAGCRESELKRMPDTLPDIKGNIIQLSEPEQDREDEAFTILVKTRETEDRIVPEARIRVTEETKIEDQKGKELSASALKQGQEVDVWFANKIIGSSPVQADAIAIKIRSQE